MSQPRTRLLAGVAAWAAAVGAALAVGLTAVGAIGTGLLGQGPQPLTPQQVDVLIAASDPPSPTPLPTTPAPAPTAAPAPAGDPGSAPEVVATAGGTVLVRCVGGRAEVVSATPAQGFRVQTEQEDDGPRVRFRGGDVRFEIDLTCAGGRPVADVETDD